MCFWNELSDSLPDRIFGIAGHFLGILLRVGTFQCRITISGLKASTITNSNIIDVLGGRGVSAEQSWTQGMYLLV